MNYFQFWIFVVTFFCLWYIASPKRTFWYFQPVFHTYDLSYYLRGYGSGFVISTALPKPTKFTNLKTIHCFKYPNIPADTKRKIITILKHNYLANGDNVFIPTSNNIWAYFKHHKHPCFVSVYRKHELFTKRHDYTNIVANHRIIGTITSRPMYINLAKDKKCFTVFYVDLLCVDASFRKKGIAQQLIQTHQYIQTHACPNIVVSVFKNEDEITGIVPICAYSTYGFSIQNIISHTRRRCVHFADCVFITPKNYHLFHEFLTSAQTTAHFDMFAIPAFENIITLVKTKNIYIYAGIKNNKIDCCFLFKETGVLFEKGKSVITCFASINQTENNDEFYSMFEKAILQLYKHRNFQYLGIENISDNNVLIDTYKAMNADTPAVVTSPTAFYFYNYIRYSVPSNKTFFLC